MKYFRYLFLFTGLAYAGAYLFTPGLFYSPGSPDTLVPVTQLDESFLNDNLSLLMAALAALITFAVLHFRPMKGDQLILVIVLSFLLQFGAFAWIEEGSVYATALQQKNWWLLAGLIFQSLILMVTVGLIVLRK